MDPLDRALPDPERVRMARREVAHVQDRGAERRGLDRPALGEEPVGDAALVEHIDRARVQAAGP